MSHLVTPYGTFNLIQYDTEQEFERAIVAHVNDIFGERRIYLDCKRRIGAKDGKQSVPDAYLIDVSIPNSDAHHSGDQGLAFASTRLKPEMVLSDPARKRRGGRPRRTGARRSGTPKIIAASSCSPRARFCLFAIRNA